MRQCKKCNEMKELAEFPKYSAKGVHGFRHTCKICWNKKWSPLVLAHSNRYYQENSDYREKAKMRARKRHSKNKDEHRENGEKYAKKHRHECNVRMKTRRAIAAGKIEKQDCEVCKSSDVHAHHDDYDKPYDVQWLCPYHHGERHRIINRCGQNNYRSSSGQLAAKPRKDDSYDYRNRQ